MTPDIIKQVIENRLDQLLPALIAEQSEGEWSERQINADVATFRAALTEGLCDALNAAQRIEDAVRSPQMVPLPHTLTRVEVIESEAGRAYTNYSASGVFGHLQDDDRTLKIFLSRGEKHAPV